MDIFHNILTSVMDDIAPPRSSRIYKNYHACFNIIYSLLVVKSVSSRKAHHGPGRGTLHRGRSKQGKVNRIWKTVGLDEVGSTRARTNMGRTMEGGPV